MADNSKYDPVAYLKQQLQNYITQNKLDTSITDTNKKTVSTKADTDARNTVIAKSKDQLTQLKNQIPGLDKQISTYQSQYNTAKSNQNNYQNAYNNAINSRNAESSAADAAARNAKANQKVNAFPFYGRTIAQIWGTDPNRWPAQYRTEYIKDAQARQQQVVNRYQPTLQSYQNSINSYSSQASSAQNQVNNYNNQKNQVNTNITNTQKTIDSNASGITANSKALTDITNQQNDIDKKIESFQGQVGPKTELGATIKGSAADSINAAKEAAKSIAGGLNDADKSNLQNLLNTQAENIAKTFGGNPDDIKKQLNAEQYFAAGKMPQQLTPDQFKQFAGNAIKQDDPALAAKRLEAGQIVGGDAASQAAIQKEQQNAQNTAHGVNQAIDQTKQNIATTEAKRQADLAAATNAAKNQFSQEQKDLYQQGGTLNNNVFQASDPFSQFQNSNYKVTAQQPVAQQPTPNTMPQTGGPGSTPPRGQIPLGRIGQFQNAMRGAVQPQIKAGFASAASQVKPQFNTPKPQQIAAPDTQPQDNMGSENMLGSVRRPASPQGPQRGQLGPQGFGQRQQGGGQRGMMPNPQGSFGSRYTGPNGPVSGQPQSPSMQQSQVQAQANGTATTPTHVVTQVKVNPYNQGQNVQEDNKKNMVTGTAGMRMPR